MKISMHSYQLETDGKYKIIEDKTDFNNLVLTHIKNNQPDGTLLQLLNEMKGFSPEIPVTMQKLNSALLYSDTILRSDLDYINYTNEILDKRTSQVLGLTMFINVMLNNISHQYDED